LLEILVQELTNLESLYEGHDRDLAKTGERDSSIGVPKNRLTKGTQLRHFILGGWKSANLFSAASSVLP